MSKNFNDYVDKHKGEKMIVIGLSPQSLYNFIGTGCYTIGVNDVGRYYPTDYTVCVDPEPCFKGDRWNYITKSKSRAVFSQLQIPHERLCKIKLNELRGSFLKENCIDISYTSTFVAANIAFKMGAKKIGITGQDHTDENHSLNDKIQIILQHLKELKDNLTRRGVQLVSLSPISRINEVLEYQDASFF